MAHFAEIDRTTNTVLRVLVIPDDQEHRGQDFISQDLGLSGWWVQCSYNNRIRKQYPGIGYTYDLDADVFIAPQPYPSWSLDANHDWQPPIPMPDDGKDYHWDQDSQTWQEILL